MAREIQLSGRNAAQQNAIAIVDDEDYSVIVSLGPWHLSSTGYAVKRSNNKTIRMHRLVASTPVDSVTDHINHDRLDNRKSNLRNVTQQENMRNRTNQGKGYWFQQQNQNWVVEINSKHVGVFQNEEEAAQVAIMVRAGGTYIKPERKFCRKGHSLDDAYIWKNGYKACKTCQSISSKEYYKRKFGGK